MDYQVLNDDNKRQMLRQRIGNLEAEHYGHELNLSQAQALLDSQSATKGDKEQAQQAIAYSKQAMATIEDAHAVALADLQALPEPDPGPEPEPAPESAEAPEHEESFGPEHHLAVAAEEAEQAAREEQEQTAQAAQ